MDQNPLVIQELVVNIDNSWINPARLSKEVERVLKIRIEEMQQRVVENEEKLEAAFEKVAELEEVNARLNENNERTEEALSVLNKECKELKEKYTKDLQDMSSRVRVKTHI